MVHAGSSLHYVDDWRGTLRLFTATGAAFLVFVDLPAGDIDTFVTAQWFHGRQIPVRFWNVGEFASCLKADGYEVIVNAAYAGPYLERDAALPTAHFDARHRLDRCRQLIVRRRAPVAGS